jgi:hypothetical protein
MALRDDIQRRIDKKRAEIGALESQMRDATVYVQALEDTLKLLPRETDNEMSTPSVGTTLRMGSKVDRARGAILSAGKPLHVIDLLKAIGIANEPEERAALAGSLSSYARKREIFSRPAPNTFGLLELRGRSVAPSGPPPNFGMDQDSISSASEESTESEESEDTFSEEAESA